MEMLLQKEIIQILEQGQSRKTIDDVIIWAGNDAAKFKIIVQIIQDYSDQSIRDRAAWAMSYLACDAPSLVLPHWNSFIKLLTDTNTSSPILRNIVRFMQEVNIPSKHQGAVIDRCFELVNDPQQDIAIRAFGLTVIANHLKEYPEIAGELKLSIDELMPYASTGLKNRAGKILQKIDKLQKLK